MKKVLVDTNVILDIALERRDFYEDAQNVLVYCKLNFNHFLEHRFRIKNGFNLRKSA